MPYPPRGAKLTPDATWAPLEAADDVFRQVDHEDMRDGWAPWFMDLPLGRLDVDKVFSDGNQTYVGQSVPFIPLPLQENYASTTAGTQTIPDRTSSAPRLVLDEIHVSWDQRDEPCAIVSDYENSATAAVLSANGGKMSFDWVERLNIEVSLLSKTPRVYGSDDRDYGPDAEVVGFTIPYTAFVGDRLRGNPFVQADLGKELDPYTTYLVHIGADELFDTGGNGDHAMLPSLHITLKGRVEVVRRTQAASVQNAVSGHGAGAARATLVTSPAAGDDIDADNAGGLEVTIGAIERMVVADKLQGGLERDSAEPPNEDVRDNAAWGIVSIPLFNNRHDGGIFVNSGELLNEPWMTALTDDLWDRQVVAVEHSMEIHHAVVAYNWQGWEGGNYAGAPTPVVNQSTTFSADVWLWALRGIQADNYDYDLIASWSASSPPVAAGWTGALLDRIEVPRAVNVQGDPALAVPVTWGYELHAAALDGAGGSGPVAQGQPIFVGRSSGPRTNTRTNLGGVAPATAGEETSLVAAIKLADSDANGFDPLNPGYAGDDLLVGWGGHWLHLIVKRYLTR